MTVPGARILRAVWFLVWFLNKLVQANLLVAWEVVTPRHSMRPGIIAVPIRSRTDVEVTLLANVISFTPGTLSLEVSDDRSVLYVHALHVSTPEDLRRQVLAFEDKLLGVLR